MSGRRITHVIVLRNEYVERGLSSIPHLNHCIFLSFERRGKFLAAHLSNDWAILYHLGMSGRLLLLSGDSPIAPHTHLRILLEGGLEELRQWDPRRFGFVSFLRSEELQGFPSWAGLGTDAFAIDLSEFRSLLQGRKQPVKSFLLDQRRIAGLGNIYADESLYRAGIHPLRTSGGLSIRETEKLWKQIRRVLRDAIAAGGSTTHDYQTLDGRLGEFQRYHRVYRRTGEPCLECGATIERCVVGGRGTHFCPHCQPQSSPTRK